MSNPVCVKFVFIYPSMRGSFPYQAFLIWAGGVVLSEVIAEFQPSITQFHLVASGRADLSTDSNRSSADLQHHQSHGSMVPCYSRASDFP